MVGGWREQRGFTYLMVLWWVALSGVMLVALGHHWRFERQREREAEMVARAQEIVAAIEAYRAVKVAAPVGAAVPAASWPASLDALVDDTRGPVTVHHLRRHYADPLTGSTAWGLVPVAEGQPGIRGVYSLSLAEPIAAPQRIARYADWRFEAKDGQESAPSGP